MKQNLQEIKRMQKLAGISLKECGMGPGLNQPREDDEMNEMTDTGVGAVAGAGLGIAAVVRELVLQYKQVKKQNPEIDTIEGIKQAFQKALNKLQSSHGS